MSETDLLKVSVNKDLTTRDIALVLIYILDEMILARTSRTNVDYFEVFEYIPKLYTSTQSINDLVANALKQHGVPCYEEDYVRNWIRELYQIDSKAFDDLVAYVETHVKELRE